MITKYVNTDSTVGTQDGSSNTSGSSGTAAFASLDHAFDWIAANDATLTDDYTIECCAGTGLAADTTEANLNITSMNAKSFLIRGNRGHAAGYYDGNLVQSSSHYRLITNSTGFTLQFSDNSTHTDGIIIDGIQAENQTATGFRAVFPINSSAVRRTIRKCRIRDGGSTYGGIGTQNSAIGATTTVTIENNLIVGFTSRGIELSQATFFSGVWTITNNTIYGRAATDTGIQLERNTSGGGTQTVRNNAVANCGTADITINGTSGSLTRQNNYTEDATSPDTDITPGAGTLSDVWTSPGTTTSSDFSLKVGSVLLAAGTATGAPTDDIKGTTRDATPDVGAFETVAGGGAAAPPRRRHVFHH